MARSPRPKLFALEAGRRRAPDLPRVSPWRVLAVLVVGVVLAAVGFLVWRVWPLTDTGSGVVPETPAVSGGGHGSQSPAHAAAPMDDARASKAAIPGVRAAAGILLDARTGKVLWEHRAHAPLPVASLTKLMTALLAVGHGGLDHPFTVTPAMLGAPGYTVGLTPGQRVTPRDMLAAALLASGNDAADALAVHSAGSIHHFVHRMNQRAAALGLADTRYSNPSGIIDAGNHSSAWDVASLSRTVLHQKVLRHLVRRPSYRARNGAVYLNRNPLVSTYLGAIGIKTGSTTAAGQCLAAAARQRHRTLIAVLLHARGDPAAGAATLLDWGFAHDRR
ncbi:MAG TPA: serine hydrolase [Gaiellales bacterium]|jgi:D-alanyl-D-alanine carboxypeptidase|nr:serine hydrolase [Gaiellales bacterium]